MRTPSLLVATTVAVALASAATFATGPVRHDHAQMPMTFDVTQASPQMLDIKDHPQKARYNSPDAWKAVDHQCHWKPGQSDVSILTHIHLTLKMPWYAILRGELVVVPFKLQMFKVDGFLSGVYVTNGVRGTWDRRMVWDGIDPDGDGRDDDGRPLRLVGDPNGLKIWTGRFTIDPTKFEITRGWTHVNTQFEVRFSDERVLTCSAATLVYVETDPTAPDQTGDVLVTGFPRWGATFATSGMGRQGQDSALHFLQLLGFLPLEPIIEPWPLRISGSRYGLNEFLAYLAPGKTQIVLAPDLHMGNPGVVQAEAEGMATVPLDYVLNPAGLALGPNRILGRWSQPTRENAIYDGTEQIEALMTLDVEVGDGPPPIDSDGDGVPDNLDQCDTQPGPPPSGCPIGPPAPVAAVQSLLNQIDALAPQFPTAVRDGILALTAKLRALVGGGN